MKKLTLMLFTVVLMLSCGNSGTTSQTKDGDNTAEADRAFSEYFGEAQKVTRDAYTRYVADAIGEALLDDTNTEI